MRLHGSDKGQTVHILISELRLLKWKWTNLTTRKANIRNVSNSVESSEGAVLSVKTIDGENNATKNKREGCVEKKEQHLMNILPINYKP